MEILNITHSGSPVSEFIVQGFEKSMKIIKLTDIKPIDKKSKRLAHLALHKQDLEFSKECLEAIKFNQYNPIRNSLWISALIYYCKCFGSSKSRCNRLDGKKIYHDKLALENFKFIKNIRNKHYVHDENSLHQSYPGAIINGPEDKIQIEKIITFVATTDFFGQEVYSSLCRLVDEAIAFVESEYDKLSKIITGDLEKMPSSQLMSMPEIQYKKPNSNDVSLKRED